MDRNEYLEKMDEIQELIDEGDKEEALELLDDMNWKKIHNVNALIKSAQMYEQLGELEDAKDLLLLAHERSPIGRMIIYHLANLCVTMGDLTEAENYYQDFIEIAPHDNLRYLLKYNICKAKGADDNLLISILEALKDADFIEEWAYELALLYHKNGMADKCVELCDEIILWFGDGPYVEKALEMKLVYRALDKDQEDKYRELKLRKDGITEIRADKTVGNGEILHEDMAIPEVSLATDKFNTINLQAEIKKNIEEIMQATAADEVSESMANIKVLVEDMPYLKIDENATAELEHITQKEIDTELKNSFLGYLDEEYDGQISMFGIEQDKENADQVDGQLTMEDVMSDWEKTKRAAEAALEEANRKKLESLRAIALEEAHQIMDKLEDLNGPDIVGASKIAADMNQLLQAEIEKMEQVQEGVVPSDVVADDTAEEPEVEVIIPAVEPEENTETEGMVELTAEAFAEEAAEEPEEEPAVEEVIEEPETEPEIEETIEEPETSEGAEVEPEAEEETVEPEEEPEVEEAAAAPEVTEEFEVEPEVEEVTEEAADDSAVIDVNPTEEIPAAVLKKMDDKILSAEEKKIFSYFMPVKGMEESICNALTGARQRLLTRENIGSGNIIVIGEKGTGKTMMATNLIKTLQKDIHKPNNKIGKIDADKLNDKNLTQLMSKLHGGALIIEEAGQLSRETVIALALLMAQEDADTFVILEGEKEGIETVMRYSNEFAKQFTATIEIPVFTINELVNFAKAYAADMECSIDEVGVLALYNRINDIQKLDHVTSLDEVKEIMDEAIDNAEHKGLKGLIGKLSGKRYDAEGFLILKEEDFEE